jgi:hypothetical protein
MLRLAANLAIEHWEIVPCPARLGASGARIHRPLTVARGGAAGLHARVRSAFPARLGGPGDGEAVAVARSTRVCFMPSCLRQAGRDGPSSPPGRMQKPIQVPLLH